MPDRTDGPDSLRSAATDMGGRMRNPMNPNQEARYREATAKISGRFNVTKTQVCQGCKTPRSIAQFEDGKAHCRKCRGVK